MEHPYNLSKEEVIRRIRSYDAEPDLENKNFDIYDQLLACEAVTEGQEEYNSKQHASPYTSIQQNKEMNESGHVSGNGNGTYKRQVNDMSSLSKHEVIEALKQLTHRTPPIEIAKLLEQLFIDYPSKEGHWLYVAQHWNPRAINRVIAHMIKSHSTGAVT
ncbi:MAG: hypothetical protein ACREBJ_06750, partial [Nitrosotalea sp.]